MKVSEFTFDSSTAHNKIFTRLYEPDGESKAVLQISHGMAEHSALYKPFCEYMAQRGFVVVINDHLGHGRSVTSGALYGHFGERAVSIMSSRISAICRASCAKNIPSCRIFSWDTAWVRSSHANLRPPTATPSRQWYSWVPARAFRLPCGRPSARTSIC